MVLFSFLDNYNIVRTIGRGSYGTVELIENKTTKEQFALKTIEITKRDDLNEVINEIKIMENFQSKYITKIINWTHTDTNVYIIMEYAENGDLDILIKKQKEIKKPFDDNIISKIIYQTACGIRELHDNKILHRDIKPSNVLVFPDFNVKLADFGISKILSIGSNAYTQIGTPFYMSPEIINGYPYSYSNDFWGLGCVYYELVTLSRPFAGTNILALFNNISHGKIDFKKVPFKYRQLIKNLLNQDKSKRYDCKQIFAYYVKHFY